MFLRVHRQIPLGAPGHRRHGLEVGRGQGRDRAAGAVADAGPVRWAAPAATEGRRGRPAVEFHFNGARQWLHACRLLRRHRPEARVLVTGERPRSPRSTASCGLRRARVRPALRFAAPAARSRRRRRGLTAWTPTARTRRRLVNLGAEAPPASDGFRASDRDRLNRRGRSWRRCALEALRARAPGRPGYGSNHAAVPTPPRACPLTGWCPCRAAYCFASVADSRVRFATEPGARSVDPPAADPRLPPGRGTRPARAGRRAARRST